MHVLLEEGESRKVDLLLSLEYIKEVLVNEKTLQMFVDYASHHLEAPEHYGQQYKINQIHSYLKSEKEPESNHWACMHKSELNHANIELENALLGVMIKIIYAYDPQDKKLVKNLMSAVTSKDYTLSLSQNNYDNVDAIENHTNVLLWSDNNQVLDSLIDAGLYINSTDHMGSNLAHYLMYQMENPRFILHLHHHYGLDIYVPNHAGHKPIDYITSEPDIESLRADWDCSDTSLRTQLLKDLTQPLVIKNTIYTSNIQQCYYQTYLTDDEFISKINNEKYKSHDFLTLALLQKRKSVVEYMLIHQFFKTSTQAYFLMKKSADFMLYLKTYPELLGLRDDNGNTLAHLCAKHHLFEALAEIAKIDTNLLSVKNKKQLTPMSYILQNDDATDEQKKEYVMYLEKTSLSATPALKSDKKFKL